MSHTLNSQCDQLRTQFVANQDRFQHVIECRVEGTFVPVLQSIEGTTEQDWPPSSPLQEIHPCRQPDEQLSLLGTGMAGRSFWSLSVTPAERALVFDHACRPPKGVASHAMTTYETTLQWNQRSDGAVQADCADIRLLVIPVATPSSDPPAVQLVDRRLRIVPVPGKDHSKSGQTHRWSLQFRVDDA